MFSQKRNAENMFWGVIFVRHMLAVLIDRIYTYISHILPCSIREVQSRSPCIKNIPFSCSSWFLFYLTYKFALLKIISETISTTYGLSRFLPREVLWIQILHVPMSGVLCVSFLYMYVWKICLFLFKELSFSKNERNVTRFQNNGCQHNFVFCI